MFLDAVVGDDFANQYTTRDRSPMLGCLILASQRAKPPPGSLIKAHSIVR